MKHFIITIDTEGDNLWSWKQGDPITTENAKYLQRFQELCDSYGFKPVWLTNYEMISDPVYVDFITKVEQSGTGELGMHLHAWNTLPEYQLEIRKQGAPYLIEYPADIMEEKIAFLTEQIRTRTGITPVTHRAGRWAMNRTYFELLKKYGYRASSVTSKADFCPFLHKYCQTFFSSRLCFSYSWVREYTDKSPASPGGKTISLCRRESMDAASLHS